MNMKRIILVLMLLLSCVAGSYAQAASKKKVSSKKKTTKVAPQPPVNPEDTGEPTPEAMASENVKLVKNMFKLSSEQFGALYKAELEYCQWERSMRGKPGLNKKSMDEAANKKDNKYKAILSPDQFQQYYKVAHPEKAATAK